MQVTQLSQTEIGQLRQLLSAFEAGSLDPWEAASKMEDIVDQAKSLDPDLRLELLNRIGEVDYIGIVMETRRGLGKGATLEPAQQLIADQEVARLKRLLDRIEVSAQEGPG
jgi:hypothetical protein